MSWTFGTSSAPAQSTANPFVQSFTTNSADTLLVVGIPNNIARTGGSPTFNGTALTQVPAGSVATAETSLEIWYMINPPTTTANVSIPNSGASQCAPVIATARSTSTPVYTNTSNATATSTNPTVDSTVTTPNNIIFALAGDDENTWSPSGVTGTDISSGDVANWGRGLQYRIEATSGTYAMGWTDSSSSRWAVVTAAFTEAVSVTVSPAVIDIVSSVQDPTVQAGAIVSPAVITVLAGVQAPTVTTVLPPWTNPSKNSSSWGNTAKNSATWTNASKNSSTWTNEDKS